MIVHESYKVIGMTCASCAISLESYLKAIKGITHVSVNYPNQSILLDYDETLASKEQIKKAAQEIGYEILMPIGNEISEDQFEEIEYQRLQLAKKKLIVAITLSTPIFIISMFLMGVFPAEKWIQLILAIPVICWAGSEFYINAFKRIKRLSTNMDTLVALSTGIAFAFSVFNTVLPSYLTNRGIPAYVYYESAVVIITLILLGRFLEERAKGRTSSAIKELMGLTPKHATVIRNGEEINVPISEILKGDLIVVKPGSKIPIDGVVKKGDSYIDESMITGEPIPVHKKKGEKVFAGTVNNDGVLRILSTGTSENTLISQIIRQVKEAQASKPKIQRIADKIAGIFVPIVLIIAVFSAVIWYIFGPEPQLTYSLSTLITVLIIACPCALGLATPTALMVGIGKGAKNGILVKNAEALEVGHKINALILDKTGTITEGKPSVSSVTWKKNADTELNKQILYHIENSSDHPIAKAITEHFSTVGKLTQSSTNFKNTSGKGVQVDIDGKTYFVGNSEFMNENHQLLSEDFKQDLKTISKKSSTRVYFASNSEILALLTIEDTIKPEVKEALKHIHDRGIETYMLTGDNWEVAKLVGQKVGIDNIHAKVLPHEKGEFVKRLQEEGKIVAMVGDGINDSHALAVADVGIAMGGGTDIAMESANVTLIASNIKHVLSFIILSAKTMKAIRQNLFWAFIYNLIAIPIAAGLLYPSFHFLLNPMIAGAAMSLSSISVLLNSLSLKQQSLN